MPPLGGCYENENEITLHPRLLDATGTPVIRPAIPFTRFLVVHVLLEFLEKTTLLEFGVEALQSAVYAFVRLYYDFYQFLFFSSEDYRSIPKLRRARHKTGAWVNFSRMPVTIRLPTVLTSLSDGRQTIEVSAESVGEAFRALEDACPGLSSRLLDDSGVLRRYVNVFKGQENIRNLQGFKTPLQDGDELVILPAVAGGVSNDVEKVVLNLVARYDQVKEPWIWRICTDFNVKVNILKANIDEDFGWAQIELEGPIEEVQRCIAWLHTTGLHIEPYQRSVGADAAYS